MKLVGHFADFLREPVNLNQTRIDTLESSVEAIKDFVRASDWKPRVWSFIEQGSWAHDTIIRPVDGGEFDADLLVIVDPVEGWSANDYVTTLGAVFKGSGVYKGKVSVWEYCVTITYAGQRKIDVAPCVRGRLVKDRLEVCNGKEDGFERSEPILYTEWIKEKNGFSGTNSFRKVTRLLKYLRDIKDDFKCSSVLLTTLIADRINWYDAGDASFKDVPTTLKTIIGRLDAWLSDRPDKPKVENPHLKSEDFAADLTQQDYSSLRSAISDLRQKVDHAFDMKGKYASVEAWRDVFGSQFAKGVSVLTKSEAFESADYDEDEGVLLAGILKEDAAHDNRIVDLVGKVGRWLWSPSLDRPKHMRQPIWPRADIVSDRVTVLASWSPSRHSPDKRTLTDFEELPPNGGVWFDVVVNAGARLPAGHSVRYRITNTGAVALALKKGRGGFETPQEGNRRWEPLEYRGVHLAEAFIIRDSDSKLVGQSLPFHVVIR